MLMLRRMLGRVVSDKQINWLANSVMDQGGGGHQGRALSLSPNSFIFMQFSTNIL